MNKQIEKRFLQLGIVGLLTTMIAWAMPLHVHAQLILTPLTPTAFTHVGSAIESPPPATAPAGTTTTSITVPETFVIGTTISSSGMNTNFKALADSVNGIVDGINFANTSASIIFPQNLDVATASPMIQMFQGGANNANRMVLGHSPNFANWGLMYEDSGDRFHFLNSGRSVMTVDLGGGRVGIGTSTPGHPLHLGSGAHVTTGGVWTNASSRTYKENIAELELQEAMKTLQGLEPVKYKYKGSDKEQYVGFIAEDVPALVATEDRKGLSPMDIVAVLTKVVQQQQKEIETLKAQNVAFNQRLDQITQLGNVAKAVSEPLR